jgi:hypothetical protein
MLEGYAVARRSSGSPSASSATSRVSLEARGGSLTVTFAILDS